MKSSAGAFIKIELLHLLYQQIKFALWAESLAAIGLTLALWREVDQKILISWLLLNLVFCGVMRHILVYYYRKSSISHPVSIDTSLWLTLFAIGAFLSGISWGFAGWAFMIKNDILRQTFLVFLLMGVTAAANSFYSPVRTIYALFLFPAFLPFAIWLFLQGGVFIILGVLALIYIIMMLAISFYSHKLIYTSLFLRFENNDLINNLSIAKNTLEKRSGELEKSLSLVRATLESTTDGILVVNAENKIEDFNQKFINMWKIPLHKILKSRNYPEIMQLFIDQIENHTIILNKINELQINLNEESFDEIYFKDGRIFERYSLPERVGHQYVGRVWSFRDVTNRKFMEAKLFHQANFDSLTDLPNRALLLDRITQSITYAKKSQFNLAILFLDIDRFKLINDTLGHAVGDKLLIEVSRRLKNCTRENDTVSREGGDEFVIILGSLETESNMFAIARKMLGIIAETFIIDGNKINITVSLGISFYPKDGDEAEGLVKNADIAMYRAKELGRNNFQFFTEEMNKKVLARLRIENQLRHALEFNEFSLLYQPIVSLETRRIVGVEALLRWYHPELGEVSPSDFIPIAEESGMIIPIGEWVLRTACAQTKSWHKSGFTHLTISVNLSSRQFKQMHLFKQINQILSGVELDPHFLTLELTESIIMDDIDKNIEILQKMRKMGIAIVVDDFGVGYSSLNYLKRLPVNKLKIDRSFVQDIPNHADDMAITSAIIALAGKLNMQVIAEGVETEKQLQFLIEHQCDEIQGFYFSKPLEAEECTKLLRENKVLAFPQFA